MPRFIRDLVVTSLLLTSIAAHSQPNNTEQWNSGWSLHIDNDLFAGGGRDQDYTGGISATLAGQRAADYKISLDPLRAKIDSIIGFDRTYRDTDHFNLHGLEFGFALFTPSDITVNDVIAKDHPYGSLFFCNYSAGRLNSC